MGKFVIGTIFCVVGVVVGFNAGSVSVRNGDFSNLEGSYQRHLVVEYGVAICGVKAEEIRAGDGSPLRVSWSEIQKACLVGVTERATNEVEEARK